MTTSQGCEDCGSKYVNCPMIHDSLWSTIAEGQTLLCWSCAEHRLGRDIHAEDLRACGWTDDLKRVAYRINAGRWWERGRRPYEGKEDKKVQEKALPVPGCKLELGPVCGICQSRWGRCGYHWTNATRTRYEIDEDLEQGGGQ